MLISRTCVAASFLFALSASLGFSQASDETPTAITDQNRTGDLGFTSYVGLDAERVDVATGSLRINIPIVTVPGRGGHFTFGLRYDSSVWVIARRDGANPFQSWAIEKRNYLPAQTNGLWEASQPYVTSVNSLWHDQCDGIEPVGGTFPGNNVSAISSYIYTDSSGAKHIFPHLGYKTLTCLGGVIDATNLVDYAADESGIRANLASESSSDPTVYLADGTQDLPTSAVSTGMDLYANLTRFTWYGNFLDPNGNKKFQYPGGLDTLGRAPVQIKSSSGNQIVYMVFDSAGVERDYTVNFTDVAIATNFNFTNSVGRVLEVSATRKAVQSLILPNGLSYQFVYDNYGEITSLTLPSGATITYEWSTKQVVDLAMRYVSKRTVNVNGQMNTWDFSHVYSNCPDLQNISCDVVAETGPDTNSSGARNQSTYSVLSGNIHGARIYSGSASGTPMRQVVMTFAQNSAAQEYSSPDSITTTLDDGQVSRKEFDYEYLSYSYKACDNGMTCDTAGGPSTGTQSTRRPNVLATREYHYGVGAPGPLARTTVSTYLHTADSSYADENIVDRMKTYTVYDGAASTVNQKLQHTFDYDTTTVSSATGNPATSSRGSTATKPGNLTDIRKWRNTDGATITTATYTYDSLGNIRSVADAENHTTTYLYDDSFNGTCGAAGDTQAYVSQITNALGQQIRVSRYGCTGLVASHQDQNDINAGRQGTTYTYDLMNRPLCTNYPDGGQTCLNYNGDPVPPHITKTLLASPNPNIVTDEFYDGAGRITRSQLTSDPEGADLVDTSYDVLGRIYTLTNPYRSTADPTYGTSTTIYDAVGRASLVIPPDGSSTANNIHTDFSGNSKTITDQTGRQRTSYNDALGRLIRVDEPGEGLTADIPPSGSTGSFSVGGSEQAPHQTLVQSAASGSGSVTIAGTSQEANFTYDCSIGDCVEVDYYDSGTVSIAINGTVWATANWYNGELLSSIASDLAWQLQNTSGSPVTSSSSGNTVFFTALATGAGTNYALSTSTSSSNPSQFGSGGVTATPSGSSLSGGQDTSYSYTYDSGTIHLAVGSFSNTASYANGDSANSVAAKVAQALNATGSPVTASASGTTVSLSSNGAGASTNYALSAWASTDYPQYFGSTSFTAAPASSPMSGGGDGTPPHGNGVFSLTTPATTLYSYDALDQLLCVEQHGGVGGTGCSSNPSSDASSPWRVRRFTYNSLGELTSSSNPESGTTGYNYDDDGQVSGKTDARGLTISYAYDSLHRIQSERASDGSMHDEFYYDASGHGSSVGRLTHASNDVNAAFDPTYDAMGRVVSQTYCIPSDCSNGVAASAQYDTAGNLTWLTYPSGRKIHHIYTGAGRLSQTMYDSFSGTGVGYAYYTAAQGSTPTTWGYSPAGGLLRGTYGNGVTQTLAYDQRLQVSKIAQSTSAQTLFSKTYNYLDSAHGNGNNGNILSIYDNLNSAQNQAFTYDALNRLSSASQADGAFSQTFSYDAWGNVRQDGTWSFQSGADVNNRLHLYSYDAAGDLLNDGFHNYGYDANQRLKTVDGSSATYTYGPDGERARKDVGSNWTEYLQFAGNVIAEKNASGWTDYIFANGQRIAMSSSSATSSTQYYHGDHLGTARVMTDASANITLNCLYAPFGQQVSCTPDNAANHYKFTGKERDSESSLDYFGARYYSSTMGRWMSPDWADKPEPVPYADLSDPQSLNLYGYVRNNPISRADADGHESPIVNDPDVFRKVGPQNVIPNLKLTTGVLSFVPGPMGRIAALANAAISAATGNLKAAGVSAAAALIPGGGKLSKAEQMLKNAAIGKAAEKAVGEALTKEGSEIVGEQVAVRTSQGLRRVDYLTKTSEGEIVNVEAKSENATRTTLQESKDGEIANEGGTYVGKNTPENMRGQTVKVPTQVRKPGDSQ